MRKMGVGLKFVFQPILLLFLSILASCSLDTVDTGQDILNLQIDSNGSVNTTITDAFSHDNEGKKGSTRRVSVYTVTLFTIAMASVTGLGAIPFFFMQLDPQFSGVCNGMAAGVMLAASFDLIQEGQNHGNGSWVAAGIIGGGVFILLCKKFIEQFGEVSMLDIKGADAAKVVLVIGIMTLHSFGEGSGVGVSFAGSEGLSQGALVTLAIAVHNIPEGLAVSLVLASKGVSPQKAMLWSVITSLPQPIVAVPSFIFAESFDKFLPFCTGFAAGCMIWMVTAEVLPDAFKEASPTQIALASTISVAFMEALSSLFKSLSHSPPDSYEILPYLLSAIGPILGGLTLIASALAFHLQHAFLTGLSSGIAFFLCLWRPLQLLLSYKIGLLSILFLLTLGALSAHLLTSAVLRILTHKRMSSTTLSSTADSFKFSVPTLLSFTACAAAAFHAFAEGLLAAAASAPNDGGMILNSALHGLPRGAAVAGCVFSVTDSWFWVLSLTVVVGSLDPLAAAGASLMGADSIWFTRVMVVACGSLFSGFYLAMRRAARMERRRSIVGLVTGFSLCGFWMSTTNLVFGI